MIPEITIIKLLCNYQEWCESTLEVADLPKELQGVYRTLNAYHEDNNEHNNLTVGDLGNLYFSTHPRDREYAVGIFDQLDKADASAETVHKLIQSIHTSNLLRELSLASYEVVEGRKQLETVLGLCNRLQDNATGAQAGEDATDFTFVTDDLNVLIDETVRTPGLRWRLQTINRMLGSLRKGDFGFIFARPETGKTTFLASETTHMASQIPEEGGPILWFNNEEAGNKVMLRCYQAALGVTLTELFRNLEVHKKKFFEITHGKLKIYDNSHITKSNVEKLCKQYKPSLILFDQIDKIKGFDNDREDLRLGTIYQWARELAKDYAPVIGVCQADGTGEGQKWLTMGHVANAKTAKQAEADWILGIGKINEQGYDTIRYLHLSKNKLYGDADSIPEMRHGQMEVLLDANIARYGDLL